MLEENEENEESEKIDQFDNRASKVTMSLKKTESIVLLLTGNKSVKITLASWW